MSRSAHLVLRIAALAVIVGCAVAPRSHPPRKAAAVAQASLSPP
jgi:hypothetical protein